MIFFSANLLSSSIPPPLNPHNSQVDDCVAGEEEVLIEGVEVKVEAEEVAEYVGVGKNNYENWAHAKALAIFYSARKWREIRGKGGGGEGGFDVLLEIFDEVLADDDDTAAIDHAQVDKTT